MSFTFLVMYWCDFLGISLYKSAGSPFEIILWRKHRHLSLLLDSKEGQCMPARCWLRRYFFENSHGIFMFFTLPLGIPDKTKVYPHNFHEIVLAATSLLEILRPSWLNHTRNPGKKFHMFSWPPPWNSVSFLINPWKSYLLSLQYPWKFHISPPPPHPPGSYKARDYTKQNTLKAREYI